MRKGPLTPTARLRKICSGHHIHSKRNNRPGMESISGILSMSGLLFLSARTIARWISVLCLTRGQCTVGVEKLTPPGLAHSPATSDLCTRLIVRYFLAMSLPKSRPFHPQYTNRYSLGKHISCKRACTGAYDLKVALMMVVVRWKGRQGDVRNDRTRQRETECWNKASRVQEVSDLS